VTIGVTAYAAGELAPVSGVAAGVLAAKQLRFREGDEIELWGDGSSERTAAGHGRLAEAWQRSAEERCVNWFISAWMAVATFVRATRSPLISAPGYRVLFLVVVVGVLLICTLPEAAFVLPALDVVGLDIVTILVALELRHYVLFLAQLAGVPTSANVFRRGPVLLVSRCLATIFAPTNPKIWPYACMWILIAFRIVMGSMKVPPQAQG
jgi:hypothetical protein